MKPTRRPTKDSPAKLAKRVKRRWRIVLLRAKGETLGDLEATDIEAAIEAAADDSSWANFNASGCWCESGLLLRRAREPRAGAEGLDDYDVIGPAGEVIGPIFKATRFRIP
jgi:hypothetical protein